MPFTTYQEVSEYSSFISRDGDQIHAAMDPDPDYSTLRGSDF